MNGTAFSARVLPMTGPAPGAVDRKEAARQLGVSESTMKRLIDRGEIDAFQVGRQWRIMVSVIQKYMQRQTTENRKRVGKEGVSESQTRGVEKEKPDWLARQVHGSH